MRGLAKIAMVAALVALFGAAAYALSAWWAGPQKSPAIVVVIDPPTLSGDVIPLRGRASLYAGAPRALDSAAVPVDEAEEVNLENAEDPRFELNADAADGTRFFVYAWMELSNYDILCDSVALPRLRFEGSGETRRWVNAETGKPLETLRVPVRKKCADPQTS